MPRRGSVHRLVLRLKLPIVADDANGIVIRRSGYVSHNGAYWHQTAIMGTWVEQRWRLLTGGGIAGNGHVWWLAPLVNDPTEKDRFGPYRSLSAMATALRKWKKWELHV